eukprot:TRINITY_DN26422_c0_g1_i2.p1 TRINITY_DN26422_c0_g1~~TRINITY_DN26422_c0_g1_i2.p1  ORF type:complete len:521 (-),score=105.76 TRINITY_DN26422_c0_g1_i2:90-1652(-)
MMRLKAVAGGIGILGNVVAVRPDAARHKQVAAALLQDPSCPNDFPNPSATHDNKICYNDADAAAAGSGSCDQWCTLDASVGSGCGDNSAKLCSSVTTVSTVSCPDNFPNPSATHDNKICYNNADAATAGTGACEEWCTLDAAVGSGCGDNSAKMCSTATGSSGNSSSSTGVSQDADVDFEVKLDLERERSNQQYVLIQNKTKEFDEWIGNSRDEGYLYNKITALRTDMNTKLNAMFQAAAGQVLDQSADGVTQGVEVNLDTVKGMPLVTKMNAFLNTSEAAVALVEKRAEEAIAYRQEIQFGIKAMTNSLRMFNCKPPTEDDSIFSRAPPFYLDQLQNAFTTFSDAWFQCGETDWCNTIVKVKFDNSTYPWDTPAASLAPTISSRQGYYMANRAASLLRLEDDFAISAIYGIDTACDASSCIVDCMDMDSILAPICGSLKVSATDYYCDFMCPSACIALDTGATCGHCASATRECSTCNTSSAAPGGGFAVGCSGKCDEDYIDCRDCKPAVAAVSANATR